MQEASYKVEFAEDPADFEEGGGGLPVFTLDLVESHRARELEVELVVEVEPVWRAGSSETPGVVPHKHLTRLPV